MTPTEAEANSKLVRPLRSGQVTIPVEFRRSLGIDGDTMLRISMVDGGLRIDPVRMEAQTPNSAWFRDLYEYYAPVREEIAKSGITQDELYAEIDAAIEEVRAERNSLRT